MIEFAATAGMTAGSLLLFSYWFRYTCLLILSAKTTRDYAAEVAAANRLGFLEVQSQLRAGAVADLDRLEAALDRDYAVLSYLLKHASHARGGESPLEMRMLQANYRVMGTWLRLVRPFSLEASRKALEEMSLVVAHFANAMGERSACALA